MKSIDLFKYTAYGLTGLLLIFISLIVYNMTVLPAAPSHPLALAAALEDSITYSNDLDLPCRNLSHQTALLEADRVLDDLGKNLAVVGDLSQSREDRQRARDQALSLFVDPDENFIEIIVDYRDTEHKKSFTATEYFDRFLNDYHNSYQLYWEFNYEIEPLQKIDGVYRTEIRFTQLLKRFSAPDMIKKYGDLTEKIAEMILVIEETGYCDDPNDKNNTFTRGCCRIKVGNIRAARAEALTDLLD